MVKNKCSCGAITRFALSADFKIGGHSGQGLKLLFPELPKLSEETMLPLSVRICPDCGKVELFAGEEIKNSLVRIADKRSQGNNR